MTKNWNYSFLFFKFHSFIESSVVRTLRQIFLWEIINSNFSYQCIVLIIAMVIIVIHLIVWITICFTNSISSSFFCQCCSTKLKTNIVFSNLTYSFLFLYYIRTVIYLKMHMDLYILLLKLLGFIGGFFISISQFLIRFYLNGSYFTLFITLLYIWWWLACFNGVQQ